MPPRSGAPPQITFCLEYPASNRPASNQLVSNRPASLPPPGRQVPGSERSKAPIRRHDEPASFPRRAAGTGQRAQQGAYSEARRASELSQASSADESADAQRVVRCLPPASAAKSRPPRTFLLRTIQPRTAPLPTSARAAGTEQRAQQGAPRSESSGACRPHPPRKAVRLEPSCFELFSLEPFSLEPFSLVL